MQNGERKTGYIPNSAFSILHINYLLRLLIFPLLFP